MSEAPSSKTATPDPDPAAHPLVARARELLALAQTNLPAAEEAFARLGFDEQQQTALSLTGEELQEWLLLSEDCTELVRSLPPEHFHAAVRMLGDEEALILLRAASSGQLQAMMDLEWYTDNKLDFKKVRHWLELLLELPEDEIDEAFQGIDPSALAIFLRRYVRPKVSREYLLLALHLNERYLFTPDDLETRDDLVERFLNFLYAVDRDYFAEVLELLVAEDQQVVRADLYGGREDRLIQRGFPALARAEALLRPVDLGEYRIPWPTLRKDQGQAPAHTALAKAPSAPFLLHVLAFARARGEVTERTERAFVRETAELANALLLAHAADPHQPGVRKDALSAVQVLASLALEAVSGSNLLDAVERLKAMDTIELFRLGWTLTRSVAQDAWNLITHPQLEQRGEDVGLGWLAAQIRENLREAEAYMSWRRIAATFRDPEPGEASEADEARLLEQMEREWQEHAAQERAGTPPGSAPAAQDGAVPRVAGQPAGTPLRRELLTWPKLCSLYCSVELAKEELERRLGQGPRPA